MNKDFKEALEKEADEWEAVEGYEGFYKVSNSGLVYGLRRNVIRKLCLNEWGYYATSLSKPGKKPITALVHRLVARAFIPNPLNKPQVNHKDGNKLNNSVSNLEWVDDFEQQQHSFKLGLNKNEKGENHNSAKLTENIVEECFRLRYIGWTYKKITQHIKSFYGLKLGRNTINEALNGRNWQHTKSRFAEWAYTYLQKEGGKDLSDIKEKIENVLCSLQTENGVMKLNLYEVGILTDAILEELPTLEPEQNFFCKEYDKNGYTCEQQCEICAKAENAPDLEPDQGEAVDTSTIKSNDMWKLTALPTI